MAKKKPTKNKPKKRKKVTTKLLARKHSGKITQPYRIMDGLIDQYHPHLADAKIAICWRFGWNEDPDGWVKLGQCKKGSDLDRALHKYDFVLLLNHEAWNAAGFGVDKMEAVIDHELCHAAVIIDSNGEPKTDEDGRTCYRTRKHDVEEFVDVVARHGCYKRQLEQFAAVAVDKQNRPLIAIAEDTVAKDDEKPPKNGKKKSA